MENGVGENKTLPVERGNRYDAQMIAQDHECIDTSPLRGAALRAAFPDREKVCTNCGYPHQLRRYSVCEQTTDGLHTICNRCRAEKNKARNAKNRCQRTRKRVRQLANPSASLEKLLALARTIERAVGGHVKFEAELREMLSSEPGGAKLHAQLIASYNNSVAAASHLRAEDKRIQADLEKEAADLATNEDYLDAAVDAIRRQPRRRRRELIRLIERCGPESFSYSQGGGI